MPATRVFISYSHDSREHMDRVLFLSDTLRKRGVDCQLDQYEQAPPEGWPRWCLNQVEESEYVLVICTETYNQRFRGKQPPGQGSGVAFEGFVITQTVYEAQSENSKFIPVVFSIADSVQIPLILRGATRYDLSTLHGFEQLYRRLTSQPFTSRPDLGEVVTMPPRETRGLASEVQRYQREKPLLSSDLEIFPPLRATKPKTVFTSIEDSQNSASTATQPVAEASKKVRKTRAPAIYAKFDIRRGRLAIVEGSYKIWIGTKNVPDGTERVTYEVLDDTFVEPKFTVKWGARDFMDWITSYGDVSVTAKGKGKDGPWRTKSTLFKALRKGHGSSPAAAIRKALKEIKEN